METSRCIWSRRGRWRHCSCAVLLHLDIELSRAVFLCAVEHHVFEEMRDPRRSGTFVSRAHRVKQVESHVGDSVIFVDEQLHPVRKRVRFDIERLRWRTSSSEQRQENANSHVGMYRVSSDGLSVGYTLGDSRRGGWFDARDKISRIQPDAVGVWRRLCGGTFPERPRGRDLAGSGGEKLSEDYTLRVNGQAVPVYICRVSAMPFNQIWPGYQRPLDQTELAGFAYWGMSGPVTVEVTSTRPFQSVAVRPSSRGIHPVIEGRHITFTVSKPGQMTVELDGTHHALHLFANPPEADAPKPGDSDVLYFGPGVHKAGKIQLKSGQTVYVAGGAVVYGAIEGQGVSGVRILGRGVIDNSEFARGQGGGAIRFSDSSDVKIEGVIVRDPAEWCVAFFGARKVAISDVKLVGLWRYNSDGVDVCNSQDVTIRDSFIRSFDDSVVIKGLKGRRQSFDDRPVRNVRVSGLVVWCDWGRASRLGPRLLPPSLPTWSSAISMLSGPTWPRWISSTAIAPRCTASDSRISAWKSTTKISRRSSRSLATTSSTRLPRRASSRICS